MNLTNYIRVFRRNSFIESQSGQRKKLFIKKAAVCSQLSNKWKPIYLHENGSNKKNSKEGKKNLATVNTEKKKDAAQNETTTKLVLSKKHEQKSILSPYHDHLINDHEFHDQAYFQAFNDFFCTSMLFIPFASLVFFSIETALFLKNSMRRQQIRK